MTADDVVEAMARAIFLSVDHIPEVSKMVWSVVYLIQHLTWVTP